MLNRIIDGKLQPIMQAGFILSALFGFFGCGSNGDVPLFQTPDWIDSGNYGINIEIRREKAEGGALLFKPDTKPTLIKRYDPQAKTLVNVAPESWDMAAGTIARCEEQSKPFGRLEIDPETRQLVDENKAVVLTKGKHVMDFVRSPSATKVAVLSADGYRRSGSFFPVGGSDGAASGQNWHQVYSLEKRRMEAGATRIPLAEAFDNPKTCWSADDKFVVYITPLFSSLSVIDNEQP
jgi:hypothetical protein